MQTFLANKKMFRPGHFKAEVIFVIRPTTVSQDFFSQTYQVTGSFKNVQRQVGKLALPFLFFLLSRSGKSRVWTVARFPSASRAAPPIATATDVTSATPARVDARPVAETSTLRPSMRRHRRHRRRRQRRFMRMIQLLWNAIADISSRLTRWPVGCLVN